MLTRWRELLDAALAFRKDANDEDALGKIDWLTKRIMLDELGSDSDWLARKRLISIP